MGFPHEASNVPGTVTNTIVFRTEGRVEFVLMCNVAPGQGFFVAIGHDHSAAPDPLEFAAVLTVGALNRSFYGWRYFACNGTEPDVASNIYSLTVSQGTQVQVAVVAIPGQAFPVTWQGVIKIGFAPNVAESYLRSSQVMHSFPDYTYGSGMSDGKMPTSWVFPLRQCTYGQITILCPNEPRLVLSFLYGRDFMTPSLCHHCRDIGAGNNFQQAWKKATKVQMDKAQSVQGNAVTGATIGGVGVKASVLL